ncbi:SDR family NAD(P)-dependent oxidoreductase [Herbidospora cretacea]|uniref:SDR family NAD(P)-dependent oxidoreductase n=1 Tax=Herbidospora cretacea TaxID=28444 RepID=UPI0018CC2DFB|nr:SDR family oxidoreductase [Herbidospora cretacea]
MRSVLITGSTEGIGAESARVFAAQGDDVIVSGRDAAKGAMVVDDIVENGGSARFVPADLTDLDALRDLAAEAGDVDVLVNNAGMAPVSATVGQDPEVFEKTLALNLRAPYFLTQALVPGMMERGRGAIVNISTIAAVVAVPLLSVYGATKAAINELTRTWAAEFADRGVRVNAVAPGPVETAMYHSMGERAKEFDEGTMLHRAAAPKEIAEVVAFLASDKASYMTGAVVPVDGGGSAL